MQAGNIHCAGHGRLKEMMIETMKQTVSELYKHVDKDEELLIQIFKQYVFVKDKKEPKMEKEWPLVPDTKLYKEVVFLHNLYNDPDAHSRVSEITENKKTMRVFRIEMETAFDCAKADAEDKDFAPKPAAVPAPVAAADPTPGGPAPAAVPAPKPAAAAAPVYNPANFEPPAKIVDYSNNLHEMVQGEMESFEIKMQQEANAVNNYFVEFEPYVLKPAAKEATTIYLEDGRPCDLPECSLDCVIQGKKRNHISVKKSSIGIKIEANSHAKIHIYKNCSRITIDAGTESTVKIEKGCKDITVVGLELSYDVHKECQNVTVNNVKIRD